jgi:hypothetical protein
MSLLQVYLFLGFCHVMRHSSKINCPLQWDYYVRQQKCLNELLSNASSLSKCNCGFHIILFYLVLSVVFCQVFLCTWECAPFWIQEAEWKQKCNIWHLARVNLSDKISNQQIITVILFIQVTECTFFQVFEGDGLPSQICQQCTEELENHYRFKQKCENSDARLRQYLKNMKTMQLPVKTSKVKCKCTVNNTSRLPVVWNTWLHCRQFRCMVTINFRLHWSLTLCGP